jgi:hypothetical protein
MSAALAHLRHVGLSLFLGHGVDSSLLFGNRTFKLGVSAIPLDDGSRDRLLLTLLKGSSALGLSHSFEC